MANHAEYRNRISQELLYKTGDFRAYFRVYDELFQFSIGRRLVQIEHPLEPNHKPIDHEAILIGTRILKTNPAITLDGARKELRAQLTGRYTEDEVTFAMNLSVQAMLMIDSAVNHYRSPDYTIGRYSNISWRDNERFVTIDKRALKAWKLKERVGITFKATNNLVDHLLFDPATRIVYLFHHSAYIKAHLDMWHQKGATACKNLGHAQTLESGTLCPQLLVETLHSLQSVLFRYDDKRSMDILRQLVKRDSFDETCSVHEGYRMFQDSIQDIRYLYWGERLAVLYDLTRNRPLRTRFEKWIRLQTSESDAFLVAMLALLISIVVGVLSLGLSASRHG